jgi:hypothetical protein
VKPQQAQHGQRDKQTSSARIGSATVAVLRSAGEWLICCFTRGADGGRSDDRMLGLPAERGRRGLALSLSVLGAAGA